MRPAVEHVARMLFERERDGVVRVRDGCLGDWDALACKASNSNDARLHKT